MELNYPETLGSQHVSLWFQLVKLRESMWFPPKETSDLRSVFRKETSGKQRHGNFGFPKGIMRETTLNSQVSQDKNKGNKYRGGKTSFHCLD